MEIMKLIPTGKAYLCVGGENRRQEEYGKEIDLTPLLFLPVGPRRCLVVGEAELIKVWC